MLFNSVDYFVLLGISLAVYWAVPMRLRTLVLVASSYVFYGFWGVDLLGLLVATTAVTWVTARLLSRAADDHDRKVLFGAGLIAAFGPLVGFKILGGVVGVDAGAADFTLIGAPSASVLVPIGLSYYTFQATSYLIDVWRGEQEPETSIVDYAAYVAFFPQLLAGPILRARRLLPAFRAVGPRPDPVDVTEGVDLLLSGLFKKIVLADPLLAAAGRDSLFSVVAAGPGTSQGPGVMFLASVVGTALGSFFDISGYVDIARGSAKLFGIRLQRNFAEPLTSSTSFTEFFRRWQITLMGWFRDYVFRPLRGDRNSSEARQMVALLLTFMVVGLWHSPDAAWLGWGAFVGTVLVIERSVMQRQAGRPRAPRSVGAQRAARALGVTYVWALLLMTIVLAGAPGPGAVVDLLSRLTPLTVTPVDWDLIVLVAVGIAALVITDRRSRARRLIEGTMDPPTTLRAVAYGVMVVGIIVFSGADAAPFVYLQF